MKRSSVKVDRLIDELPVSPYRSVFVTQISRLVHPVKVDLLAGNRGYRRPFTPDQAASFLSYLNIRHAFDDKLNVYVAQATLLDCGIIPEGYSTATWVVYQSWRNKYLQGWLVPVEQLLPPIVPVSGRWDGMVTDATPDSIHDRLSAYSVRHGMDKYGQMLLSETDFVRLTADGNQTDNLVLRRSTPVDFFGLMCPRRIIDFKTRTEELWRPVKIRITIQAYGKALELTTAEAGRFLNQFQYWHSVEGESVFISRQSYDNRLQLAGASMLADTVSLTVGTDWIDRPEPGFHVSLDRLVPPVVAGIKGSKMESDGFLDMTVGQIINFLQANGIFYHLGEDGRVCISETDFEHYTPGGDRAGNRTLFRPI